MKNYLQNLISEQVARAEHLKGMIRRPLRFTELESLATRCEYILDQNIDSLNYVLSKLISTPDGDIRTEFRLFRQCEKEIELIEYYGISALYFDNDEIGFLNKLVHKIKLEINLPVPPPAVACFSTRYYHYQPFVNIIFAPLGEAQFMLHLPDIYHEIGHAVIENRHNDKRLREISKCYNELGKYVTEYYSKLLLQKQRQSGPQRIPMLIDLIRHQWIKYWIDEIFCDLFALYVLGPAFLWSHMHLTAKKSQNVFDFSDVSIMTHPSDDARYRCMQHGLDRMGFASEGKAIDKIWKTIPLVESGNPSDDYNLYAYPPELLSEIAQIIIAGLQASQFSGVDPDVLENTTTHIL